MPIVQPLLAAVWVQFFRTSASTLNLRALPYTTTPSSPVSAFARRGGLGAFLSEACLPGLPALSGS